MKVTNGVCFVFSESEFYCIPVYTMMGLRFYKQLSSRIPNFYQQGVIFQCNDLLNKPNISISNLPGSWYTSLPIDVCSVVN